MSFVKFLTINSISQKSSIFPHNEFHLFQRQISKDDSFVFHVLQSHS